MLSIRRLQALSELIECKRSGERIAQGDPGEAANIASIILAARRVRIYAEQVSGFGAKQPNSGCVVSFLLLQEICALGRLLEGRAEGEGGKHFDPESYRAIARKLGLEETVFGAQ